MATKAPKRMSVNAIFIELKGTIGVGLLTNKNVLAYSQCIWGWAGGGGAVWFKSKETYWRVYGLTFKKANKSRKSRG